MRSLQILINKYIEQRQELEYQIETEINATYPSIGRLDHLFDKMARLNMKNGYINQLLIDISHARNSNEPTNESAE